MGGNREILLKVLPAYVGKVDARSKRGFAPSMIALLEENDADTLRLLLSAGADPDARLPSFLGADPLLVFAVTHNREEAALVLFAAGANLDATNAGAAALATTFLAISMPALALSLVCPH